ncbi:hypothetical protein ETR_02394 [Erwinia tracheiphila PSU-1]|nr:hypothetical protein ETR_02394 [Erwinia tracheiphila PSU-1]
MSEVNEVDASGLVKIYTDQASIVEKQDNASSNWDFRAGIKSSKFEAVNAIESFVMRVACK